MAIEVFNRHEIKFKLDTKTYFQVLQIINRHMEPDPYNAGGKFYTIANLYYDTAKNDLIRQSLDKPRYKQKLRLRAYGVPKTGDVVYLEIKKKVAGLVNKRRTPITLDGAYAFTQTGIIPAEAQINHQVAQEISYLLKTYPLSPKLYLAYDRMAFFGKNAHDVRISFDVNIRTRKNRLALEAGSDGEPLLGDGIYLREVKAEKALPVWVCNMLSGLSLFPASFSKYGCWYQNMKREEKEKWNSYFNQPPVTPSQYGVR